MRDKNTVFQQKKTLNAGGKLLDLSTPKVMGILNITPDSFYAGSRLETADDIIAQAQKHLSEGADILDIGAYSSRPGATDISVQEEIDRLLPAVEALKHRFPEAILSVDTFRAMVAKTAIEAGAHIINDISAGELDETMFSTVAKLRVPYILMHMKGTPQTMKGLNSYENLLEEVLCYFIEKLQQLKLLGLTDVVIDPGFGFAKDLHQNYKLMSQLDQFKVLGFPLLAGVSRKTMVYQAIGGTAKDALNGTTVLNTIALMKGARILRVHDVKEAVEAVKIVSQLNAD